MVYRFSLKFVYEFGVYAVQMASLYSVLGSTGKLPVGTARCRLKIGKQPILPVVLGTSRYCVLIPKSCYYNVMANET